MELALFQSLFKTRPARKGLHPIAPNAIPRVLGITPRCRKLDMAELLPVVLCGLSTGFGTATTFLARRQTAQLKLLKSRHTIGTDEVTKLLQEKDEVLAHIYDLHVITAELDELLTSVLSPAYQPDTDFQFSLETVRVHIDTSLDLRSERFYTSWSPTRSSVTTLQLCASDHPDVGAYVYGMSQLLGWFERKKTNRTAIHALHTGELRTVIEQVTRLLHGAFDPRLRVSLVAQKSVGAWWNRELWKEEFDQHEHHASLRRAHSDDCTRGAPRATHTATTYCELVRYTARMSTLHGWRSWFRELDEPSPLSQWTASEQLQTNAHKKCPREGHSVTQGYFEALHEEPPVCSSTDAVPSEEPRCTVPCPIPPNDAHKPLKAHVWRADENAEREYLVADESSACRARGAYYDTHRHFYSVVRGTHELFACVHQRKEQFYATLHSPVCAARLLLTWRAAMRKRHPRFWIRCRTRLRSGEQWAKRVLRGSNASTTPLRFVSAITLCTFENMRLRHRQSKRIAKQLLSTASSACPTASDHEWFCLFVRRIGDVYRDPLFQCYCTHADMAETPPGGPVVRDTSGLGGLWKLADRIRNIMRCTDHMLTEDMVFRHSIMSGRVPQV